MRGFAVGALRNDLLRQLPETRADRAPLCGMAVARNPRVDRQPASDEVIPVTQQGLFAEPMIRRRR